MAPIIEVEHLVREFRIAQRDDNFLRYLFARRHKTVRAVDDITYSIARGEFVGYIGPNGAGKSTSIKMLAGILVPTSGVVRVNGNVPHLKRKENAANIGVVFGQRSQLWWDLPVRDSFDLLRRIYKIPPAIYKRNVDEFTELLALDKFAGTPVRQLSLGQKMRADLAAALLHNPEILFLDEPTIGLDVVAKKHVRDFMRRLKAEQRITLILTTHDMKDVEEICDRMILINEGKLMLDMAMGDVKQQLGSTNHLIVDFDQEPAGGELPHAKVIAKDGARWTYAFKRDEISANDLIAKIVAVSNVRDIFLKEPDIEDIVRGLYEGGLPMTTGPLEE